MKNPREECRNLKRRNTHLSSVIVSLAITGLRNSVELHRDALPGETTSIYDAALRASLDSLEVLLNRFQETLNSGQYSAPTLNG